jgi:hypothetical protein
VILIFPRLTADAVIVPILIAPAPPPPAEVPTSILIAPEVPAEVTLPESIEIAPVDVDEFAVVSARALVPLLAIPGVSIELLKVCVPVNVCAASVLAMVAEVDGKVIVVESVPARVRVLLTLNTFKLVIARVAAVAGEVIVRRLYVLPVKAEVIRASAIVPLETLSPLSEVMFAPLPERFADTVVAVITLAVKLPETSRETIVEELLALVAFVEKSITSDAELPVIIRPLLAV